MPGTEVKIREMDDPGLQQLMTSGHGQGLQFWGPIRQPAAAKRGDGCL
jgi:hypothetical protein